MLPFCRKIVFLAKVVHSATEVVFNMNSFIACTFSFKYEQVVMKCQTGYKSAILMQILGITTIACIARKEYRIEIKEKHIASSGANCNYKL